MNARTQYYYRTVPEPDRHKLVDLQPVEGKCKMVLEKQQVLLDKVKADPKGSYGLFAESGYSKSTILYALFREALLRHPVDSFGYAQQRYVPGYTPVVFVEAPILMDQIERFKYHDGPIPIITVNKIEKM